MMEKKMETAVMGYIGIRGYIYWGYIGITENNIETTI